MRLAPWTLVALAARAACAPGAPYIPMHFPNVPATATGSAPCAETPPPAPLPCCEEKKVEVRTVIKRVPVRVDNKDLSGCDADRERAPRTRLQEIYREAEVLGGKLVELNANRRPQAPGRLPSPCAVAVLARMRSYCAGLARLDEEARALSPVAIPITHSVCTEVGKEDAGDDGVDVDESGRVIAMSPAAEKRVREACRRHGKNCPKLRTGEDDDNDTKGKPRVIDMSREMSRVTAASPPRRQSSKARVPDEPSPKDANDALKTRQEDAIVREPSMDAKGDASKDKEERPEYRKESTEALLNEVAKQTGSRAKRQESTRKGSLSKRTVDKGKKDIREIREIEEDLERRKALLRKRLTDEHLRVPQRRKLTRQLLYVSRLLRYYRVTRRARALNEFERELRGLRHTEVELQLIVDSDAVTPRMRAMAKAQLCALQKRIRPLAYRALLERQRTELVCALASPTLSDAMRMALASHLRAVRRHIALLAARALRTPLDAARARLARRIADVARMLTSPVLSPGVRREFRTRLARMRTELRCIDRRVALYRKAAELKRLMSAKNTHPLVREGLSLRLADVQKALHRASGAAVACRLSALESTLRRQQAVLQGAVRNNRMGACVRRAFLIEINHTCSQLRLLSLIRRVRTQMKHVRGMLGSEDVAPAVGCTLESQLTRLEKQYARLLRALYRSLRAKRCISCCGRRFRQLCQLERTPEGRETLVCRTTLRPIASPAALNAAGFTLPHEAAAAISSPAASTVGAVSGGNLPVESLRAASTAPSAEEPQQPLRLRMRFQLPPTAQQPIAQNVASANPMTSSASVAGQSPFVTGAAAAHTGLQGTPPVNQAPVLPNATSAQPFPSVAYPQQQQRAMFLPGVAAATQ